MEHRLELYPSKPATWKAVPTPENSIWYRIVPGATGRDTPSGYNDFFYHANGHISMFMAQLAIIKSFLGDRAIPEIEAKLPGFLDTYVKPIIKEMTDDH